MKVIWTEQAIDQLSEIIKRKYSKDLTAKFADDIFKRISGLSQFPEKGRAVPEYNRPEIRELIYQGIRLIYKIDKKIYILAAISSRHQLPEI